MMHTSGAFMKNNIELRLRRRFALERKRHILLLA